MGLVVRDREPLESDEHDLLVLTAAHVVDGCRPGHAIEASPADGTGSAVRFGKLRRAVPLAPLPHIAVDAAVIKPDIEEFSYDNAAGGVWPTLVEDLWQATDEEPVDVYKRGAATGLTRGTLLPVAADHYMETVRARYTSGWWVWGRGGLFADRGDSGSAVFDDQHRFVGLLVALDRDPRSTGGVDPTVAAYVHGARQVLTALNIELEDEPPPKRGR
ncbi:MAG TPA: hypothetical protein VG165_07505 [Solirubrobacteraceae bacterium]|nr:hypothetical protein [Solirubrobacteraceae bacterium]